MIDTDYGFLDAQLRMLGENDEQFRTLSLNLNRMEKDFSQQLAHWRESLFSFSVAQWLEVLRFNTTVDTVTVDLSLSETTIWKKDHLKCLMIAIGCLPKLKRLVIRQNNLGQPRRLAPVQAIVAAVRRAHQIECLELWGNEIIVPSVQKPLTELTQVILEECTQLKSFKVAGFHLNHNHVAMFTPLMTLPHLTEFGLGNTSDGFEPVAKMLSSCPNIRTLTLSFVDQLEDADCMALVQALKRNQQLQILSLLNTENNANASSGISPRCQRALIQMLEHGNMTLQELKTRGDVNAEIQLYLKLNRAGRQDLFQQHDSLPSRELWVDTLIASRDDLDCSFYFLTMNPSICAT
ncbi:expressed unknown protein [Seminavis robusta]|uniref:Uncharacterized protein n=1 Tax=Seminavis robusta TaxID=568900 RepID=A0A9N8HQT7_9STRA|nr:expressed unknown protein [Seminavis robusta]|eukprot:Sro1232_g254740.1 n/a (350) ;mRNA; f:29987-31036